MWLLKINPEGIEEWNRTFGGDKSKKVYSVQQNRDGGYILAGTTYDADHTDLLILKTDSNVNEQWNRTISGPNKESKPFSILQRSDDGYITAGETGSERTESYDMWLVSTDYDGYVQWQITFGGTGHDVARSILITPD